MFSKELENLIQATLEDGKLEENEKAALVKRAQREGVDLDELEIYINSLLQKRQRELNEKKEAQEEQYEKEKAKAVGPVCPKCGKQVPPLTLVCDCGYEFTKGKGVSSVQLLFEKINNIQLTEEELNGCKKYIDPNWGIKKYKNEKKLEIISTFPVPNTKEDIIEFLAMSLPNAHKKGGLLGTKKGRLLVVVTVLILLSCILWILCDDDMIFSIAEIFVLFFGLCLSPAFVSQFDTATLDYNKAAEVWRAKFDQVLMKGRSLRGDSEFTQQLDYYENMLNSKK